MTANPPMVMIMAGGTGGHIYPGLAVAAALQATGIEVRWLGAAGGMECEKVPAHGIQMDTVRISGLRGKGLTRWLTMPFKLFRSVLEARRAMRSHPPSVAVSFGGYVAGPGGLAAWLRGIPLVVHEQNRVPGLTNRSLARFAKTVLQAFPESFASKVQAQTCGNPVRREVTRLPAPAERWRGRTGHPRILVTGGSQGARALNEHLPAALAQLPESLRPEIRHQSGKAGLEETRERYEQAGLLADVSVFIEDMAGAYAWADLVVCRSGALTVSELASAGCGSVLVPFPHAVDDHQTANGRFLEEASAAVLLPEPELSAERLAQVLEPILSDRRNSLAMAEAARSVAVDDAAEQVTRHCLRWVSV